MTVRRAPFFALVGLVLTAWVVAMGCALETSGYGETEDVCTAGVHCDDNNVCTDDSCGKDGVCVHETVANGLFPDGVTGNCKVFECKSGVQSEAFFADDVDDGDECTQDSCDSSGVTHAKTAGAVCHFQGGTGTCDVDGKCVVECGFVDESGATIGCPEAANKCTLSYCDKAVGKCVVELLDGVAVPGTTPGDCGGTYCLAGQEDPQVAPMGTTCLDPTGAIGVCNAAGACVGCNTKQDCADSTPESDCHKWVCTGGVCANTTEPDGPLAAQVPGDCYTNTCTAGIYFHGVDGNDVKVDGNECTDDVCVGGVPMNPSFPLNTPCGGGGDLYCEGGICKGCTQDVQCLGGTDCAVPKCDMALGQCFFDPEPVGKVTSLQNPGDCTQNVCDANGNIVAAYQPLDPANDNNDCTTDTCTAMNATTHAAVTSGTTCNDGGGVVCDAGAHCVGAPCSVQGQCPNGTFCTDGVCCESSCGGPCNACTGAKNGVGPNGLCKPVVTGDPDGDCPGNSACTAGLCVALAQGAACQGVAGECASGNCIDGFCCGTACNALCSSCGINPGTCSPITAGQDPSMECANGACDGTGACRKDNGQTCVMGTECLSGNCIDGYCCVSTCGGLCQACNVAGSPGACANVPNNTDPATECANGACNGGAQCKLDNGQACFGGGDCLSGNCVDGVCCNTACGGACQACSNAKTGGTSGTCGPVSANTDPDTECVGVTTCNGAGACNKVPNGGTCSLNAECNSTTCSPDLVCCNTACTGTCQACTNAKTGGTTGTCASIPSNTDPDNECSNTQVCNGSNACKKVLGDTCATGPDCLSGQCKDGVCCNNTCNGTCEACNLAVNPGTCMPIANGQDPASECPGNTSCNGANSCALFVNGTACGLSTECSSGNCIDNVCCSAACGGTCQSCTIAGSVGTCTAIPGGMDPINECPGATTCNGANACALFALGVACGANNECTSGNCVDGFCCGTPTCTGTCRSCNPNDTVSGVAGACDFIAANTDPAGECAAECNGAGVCEAANGTVCVSAAQCGSGNCVDGFCCNEACNGTCKACSAALTGAGNGTCADLLPDTDPVNECAGTQVCGMLGTCVDALDGHPCAVNGSDTGCASNQCVDGVCCASPNCNGDCKSCNQANTVGAAPGVCDFIKNNTDPDNECNGANTVCDGAGVCKP